MSRQRIKTKISEYSDIATESAVFNIYIKIDYLKT